MIKGAFPNDGQPASFAHLAEAGCKVANFYFDWTAIEPGEEVGELGEAIAEAHYHQGTLQQIRDEAIQVATLALKIEQMARKAFLETDERKPIEVPE